MSLMKSLARVAAGVVVAKGVSSVMRNRGSGQGLGGMLDSLTGGNNTASQGGLGSMLSGALGGAGSGTARQAGTGRQIGAGGQAGGALSGMLDKLPGGAAAALGGLLGGSAAAGSLATRGSQASNEASFGQLFDDAVARQDEPEIAPTPEQNAIAGLMLRAMIQAAKADGVIDEGEKKRLLDQMGDLDEDERSFVREQMAAPIDVEQLARDVPAGLEGQVYMMSLIAIDLDDETEFAYLRDLAQALGLTASATGAIHRQLRLPPPN